MPQSALVTIEIERVDLPTVTGWWNLEGLPPRPKGMDEPLGRGAWLAVADLSPGAITDGEVVDPRHGRTTRLACRGHEPSSAAPVRGQSSGRRSYR